MKPTPRLHALCAAVLAAVTFCRAADIDGKWTAEFDSQIGTQKYVFELKADGEKLAGKAIGEREGQKAEVEIKNGKIVKDEVSFSETNERQDQELVVEYKGKLIGDESKLHRKVGDFAEYDIVAKRVPSARSDELSSILRGRAEFETPGASLTVAQTRLGRRESIDGGTFFRDVKVFE